MTRDTYGRNVKLIRKGLVDPNSLGIVGVVALVFDESVTDDPRHDALEAYPDAPNVKFDKLSRVVVDSDEDKQKAEDVVKNRKLTARVVTRKVWEDATYTTKDLSISSGS